MLKNRFTLAKVWSTLWFQDMANRFACS